MSYVLSSYKVFLHCWPYQLRMCAHTVLSQILSTRRKRRGPRGIAPYQGGSGLLVFVLQQVEMTQNQMPLVLITSMARETLSLTEYGHMWWSQIFLAGFEADVTFVNKYLSDVTRVKWQQRVLTGVWKRLSGTLLSCQSRKLKLISVSPKTSSFWNEPKTPETQSRRQQDSLPHMLSHYLTNATLEAQHLYTV